MAATVLLESAFSLDIYPDDVGRYLPLFEDVATWTHVKGLSFSLAEIFLLFLLVATLLRIGSERTVRFDDGCWPGGDGRGWPIHGRGHRS